MDFLYPHETTVKYYFVGVVSAIVLSLLAICASAP